MFDLNPAQLITSIITLLIAFTIHEFSHAWTANFFGDDTPRMNGRLTLNPAAHLDLLGSLMLITVGFGWARPVPINPYVLERRSRSAVMWVSLAGPLSNFILAILAAIPFRLGIVSLSGFDHGLLPSLSGFLLSFMFINLALALFNLIPLSPLDGEKIAYYFFPPSWGRFLDQIRNVAPLILIALFMLGPRIGIDIYGWFIYPVQLRLMQLLIGG